MIRRFLLLTVLFIFCLISSVFAGTMDNLLLESIQDNDFNMAKSALANGADINYSYGSPISIAIKNQNFELVDYLIKNGADINIKVSFFGEMQNRQPIVRAASIRDNIRIVNRLLEAGADINSADSKGNTPLIVATMNLDIDTFYFLLLKNANPNQANNDGVTPLMYAAAKGWGYKHEEKQMYIAEMLLTSGADPNQKDNKFKIPLDYAIDSNFKKMIELLLPITKK